jgi:membrane-associated phospholipid phosphatase
MLVRARSKLPNGALDLVRQLVLFCGAYWLYRLVRGMVDGRAAAAFDNAREVIRIERGLGLFFEPAVNAWASANDVVADVASWMYVNSHFVVTTLALAWIYLRRNERFYFVRNMFMVSMVLALLLYMLVPTAPPRMLPEWGFTDSVAQFTGLDHDTGSAGVLFNPYAAIPSMHVAFSLMLGVTMAHLVRRQWAKALWYAYSPLVTFVVIATANHYWIDGFLGAAVAAVSAACAWTLFARARPEVWAWNGQAGTALP